MPLSFLAPAFFVALAALAVPLIVHLIQRERKEAVPFPSLMFLSQVPYKSTRRRQIRNWVLFLMRAAALAIIVAAFARPLVQKDLSATSPLAVAREVVILLDRSYSMGYGDRWDRAVRAAGGAVDGIGGEDRATLVLFDGGAVALNQATADRAQLHAVLAGAKLGSGVTRFGPAMKLAQSILEPSDKPRREVILISDFQRAGWDGGEGVRLPVGTKITPIAISDDKTTDLAVAGIQLRREEVNGRERVTVIARITNAGTTAAAAVPVSIDLNGRELQTRKVDVPAGNSASLTFDPFTVSEPNLRGTVRLSKDALPADDAFNFVLSPGQAVGVLVADAGVERASLYLQRALMLGDQPAFRVDVKRAAALSAADLAGRSVVVWNDADFPGGDMGQKLRTFVREGGGLIVTLGPRGSWDAAKDVLGGTVGRVLDRDDPGGALGYIDYTHPVFEVFRAPRSGDLAAARFFRYRPFTAEGAATVLARFDDGSPALIERHLGRGRVMSWCDDAR